VRTVSTVFRADDHPARTRVDYWHHVVAESLTALDLKLSPEGLGAKDRMWVGELGQLRVIEVSTGEPSHAVRRQRHISTDPELYKIDVQVKGRGVIRQGDREAGYRPGDFTLIDLARPSAWAFQPSAEVVAVTFPGSLLPVGRADLARLTGERLPGDSGLCALVSSFARQLPDRLDDLNLAEGTRLASTVLDLLGTTLLTRLDRGREVPPDSRRRALLHSVHAYVEEHLGDPKLSPSTIAAAHFVSIRYLHRLFEAEQTTVAEWIRRRRLERCRRDLPDPTLRDVPAGAIGARWGFTSAAHFGRLFRAAYGAPPAAYRRVGSNRQAG
jgi:AraC-like DNA-binding protein